VKDRVSDSLSSMGESKPSYPANYRGNVNNQGFSNTATRSPSTDSYAAAKNVTYEEGSSSQNTFLPGN
jgi:hypothetical protein